MGRRKTYDERLKTEDKGIRNQEPRTRNQDSLFNTRYPMTDIQITDQPLNIQSCIEWAMDPKCGGIDAFIGTVRENTKGKKVLRLEFETYESMALIEMKKIAEEVLQKFQVFKILIHHRTGVLQVGDIPVIMVVGAAHRDAAFVACHYAIDELKKNVPIWKKEIFEDGEVWVAAHP